VDAIPTLDLVAIIWFAITTGGYRLLTVFTRLESDSIAGAVQQQRLRWMRNMAERENRMIDAVLLNSLSQGNAFFASTSAIALGGLAALTGSGDKAMAFVERFPYAAPTSPMLWEMKIVLMLGIFVYAFFKFAWAFRLSHYTAIMIGATPIADESAKRDREEHARRTAALIGIAAEHANAGLRAFYLAIAAMGWFFHPWLFIALTTWMLLILARRDFFSRAKRIVSGQ
jgi:uncharacterized membrane protein